MTSLSASTAVRLARALYDEGHWTSALEVARELADRTATASSMRLAERIRADLDFLRDGTWPDVPLPRRSLEVRSGRVLHVVSSETDDPGLASGLQLQTEHGLVPQVVTEMGFGGATAYDEEDVRGVPHHRVPGFAREGRGLAEWMSAFTPRLATVARKVRPSALVTGGDPALVAATLLVGRAYDIPVVLDRRRGEKGRLRCGVATEVEGWLRDSETRTAEVADATVTDGGGPHALICALEEVGALDPALAQMVGLTPRHEHLEAVRDRLLTTEPRPLERSVVEATAGDPGEIASSGWSHEGLPPIRLSPEMSWRTVAVAHRTQGFRLHAWEFMDPALARHAWADDSRHLDWCFDLAVSWCVEFHDSDAHGTMAWYDMALALRAPKLAFLLQEALRRGAPDSTSRALHTAVVRHQQELVRPEAFAGRHNHGLYTALGQLSLARRLAELPGMAALEAQAQQRLRVVLTTQFAADGGHREHSADYHRMVLNVAHAGVADGLVDDPDLVRRLHLAQEVTGWFIAPDRRLVQIGDSPARQVVPGEPATGVPSSEFLATGGATGTPSPDTVRLLPDSGYAFVRSPQPSGHDDHGAVSYLTLMAGFHSRTHKHADDLSLTWFDRGCEILVDPGRFGYLDQLPPDSPDRAKGFFYSRPERQYVEGTRAHCTVEADGRDHDRRDRAPFGSALVGGWGEEPFSRVVAEVDHGWWRHRRELVLRSGSWLWIRDDVSATDGEDHDFRVWWQVAQEWEVRQRTTRRIHFEHASGTSMWVQSLDGAQSSGPVSGSTDPLAGWRSPRDYELEPCWSFAFHERARAHTFETLFTFGGPADSVPQHPWTGADDDPRRPGGRHSVR